MKVCHLGVSSFLHNSVTRPSAQEIRSEKPGLVNITATVTVTHTLNAHCVHILYYIVEGESQYFHGSEGVSCNKAWKRPVSNFKRPAPFFPRMRDKLRFNGVAQRGTVKPLQFTLTLAPHSGTRKQDSIYMIYICSVIYINIYVYIMQVKVI